MKIGITGHNGFIGSSFLKRQNVIPLSCNITNIKSIEDSVKKSSPDIIVNLAAKTDVDWCERNPQLAMAVNLRGAYYVSDIGNKHDIPVILISSDYIFDGKLGPYSETSPNVFKNPVNFYGLTKLAMESWALFDNVKIIRTSTLFSENSKNIFNFFDLLALEYPVYLPVFQYRSFMYLEHFIDNVLWYIDRFSQMPKILHVSGNSVISWYDFLVAIFGESSLIRKKTIDDTELVPRPHKSGLVSNFTDEFGMPSYSYLDGIREMRNKMQ
jgi:dTDP-4-dehydrorhamnose reductase